MTRVDFYILPDVDETARHRFASRLAGKAVQAGNRVHIMAAAQALPALDDVLWDYPAQQFLPHAMIDNARGEPVTLSDEHADLPATPEPAQPRVLINLTPGFPAAFASFSRVAEVVLAPERRAGRVKYRQYRDQGYPLFHHELDDWESLQPGEREGAKTPRKKSLQPGERAPTAGDRTGYPSQREIDSPHEDAAAPRRTTSRHGGPASVHDRRS